MKRQVESTQREIFQLELKCTKVPDSITGLQGNGHASLTAANAALSVGDDLKQYISGPASNQIVSCKARLADGASTLWGTMENPDSGTCDLTQYTNQPDCEQNGGTWTPITTYHLESMFYEIVLKTPFAQDPVVIGSSSGGTLDVPRGKGSSSDPLLIDAVQAGKQELLIVGSKIADKY